MYKKYYVKEIIIVTILVLLIVFENSIESMLYNWMNEEQLVVEWSSLLSLIGNHLKIVFLSTSLSLLITVFIALVIHIFRIDVIKELFLSFANLGTTFPSVAMMALLVPSVGYGFKPVFIALTVYSILPMFIGLMDGLMNIPRDILLSAESSGMTRFQLLYKIELPLAKGRILAGIKTAMIINISATTIGSVVGANTLGLPIVIGIRSNDIVMILKGALPVALLAFLVESLFTRLEGDESWKNLS